MPSTTWSAANGMIRHWDSSGRRDRFYGPSATLAPAATHKCCSSLTSARSRGAPQEHDPEKWIPVVGKRSCSTNKLERDDDSKKSHLAPEHDPEKWIPVFGKRSCSTNKLERDDDSKKSHLAPMTG